MAEKEVTAAVVTYRDENGNWQTALRGEKISVHKDDTDRVDKSGAFDKPPSEK